MPPPAARRLPAGVLLLGAAAAQTAAPLANPSFELPARAAGQSVARPSIEGWQFAHAGVIANDGS